ncbi:olfactory receptor 150-like [Hyla sarda]|uniref:olfactory receptor 150-like n=1 Tax=Hyla sarda TaxID=327740 RepID=UPI0024C3F853|nr:olfactory receptor 150-like [Hyla sarda]
MQARPEMQTAAEPAREDGSNEQVMFSNSTNETSIMYFIIKGIADGPVLQAPIFLLVLVVYLFTFSGNVTIFLLICVDCQLHTPMYFFLANLSFVDLSSTTITLHKVLLTFITGDNTVSYLACMIQMYIFASLIGHELLILAAMSYDRYVAVCNPLRYHAIMNHRVCGLLCSCCYLMGCVQVLAPVVIFSGFSCYTSNEVNHFFCDIIPLMKITCDDTWVLEMVVFIQGIFIITLLPFVLTLIPYIFIISAIFKIRSRKGKQKAFYTCSSHLTVVSLLYLTFIAQYLTPTSHGSINSKKLFSLFNTAAVPLLNPLIYSLKNRDVKAAMRRRLEFCKTIT